MKLVTNPLRDGAPPVSIRAEQRGAHVLLQVHDEGSGIEPDFEPARFEAFAQQSTGDTQRRGARHRGCSSLAS